jgi:predicted nucleic acid-binding protein
MLHTDNCSCIMKRATALHAFLPHVAVLEFPDDAAAHYAQIRADLKKRGQMIGPNDLFIAGAHIRVLP